MLFHATIVVLHIIRQYMTYSHHDLFLVCGEMKQYWRDNPFVGFNRKITCVVYVYCDLASIDKCTFFMSLWEVFIACFFSWQANNDTFITPDSFAFLA